MSNRKLAKAIQQLFKQIWKLYRSLSKSFVTWLLRTALLPNRRRATAGFVLPTTVLLVLVVTLTSGALSYRAFNNSSRVIGNVQSKAIYNAATPAVDRARSKIDYLFGKDPRLPGGVPAEEFMISMMLNAGSGQLINGVFAPTLNVNLPGSKPGQPYDLQDETRVDLNGDGINDNAWVYTDPSTRDNTDPSKGDKVIYSINLSTPEDATLGAVKLIEMDEATKAQGDAGGPFVRRGPLSEAKAVNCPNLGVKTEKGWYEDSGNSAILRKRFQVDALVASTANATPANPAKLSTLEFAQDRQLDRGNKWGAWFQYDIEVHSGTQMNWNGALHSEGNIMIGNSTFRGFLISSPSSCVFLPESNSEVSVRQFDQQNDDLNRKFFGVIAAGKINDNAYGGDAEIHRYRGRGYEVPPAFDTNTDWATGAKSPIDLATDPVSLVLEGVQAARAGDVTNQDGRIADPQTQDNIFYDRRFLTEDKDTRPYVDDTYRADNLYGPKVRYSATARIEDGKSAGDPIAAGDTNNEGGLLTRESAAGVTEEPGLDGYWERRTMANADVSDNVYSGGMRLLVGERLQLGNPFGWVAPQDRPETTRQDPSAAPAAGNNTWDDLRQSDYTAGTLTNADPYSSDNEGDPLNPLYKFTTSTVTQSRQHEAKQRRALRDNLAAVQATAVYHYKNNEGKYPTACVISTSHPGTPLTLAQSVNFTQPTVSYGIDSRFDFFSGKGTNGWEFAMPESVFNGAAMQTALSNLANFAGDPEGAFPPVQEAGAIHPDPTMTMFGNFSNLRRALNTPAAERSPAANSYMHTAACTLGALGYNISEIQEFDPSSSTVQTDLLDLAEQYLLPLMDGKDDTTTEDNPEVLRRSQLATYGYSETGTYDGSRYNPRDYDRVTPDMFLAALKRKIVNDPDEPVTDIEQSSQYRYYRLAELIHESYQIRRDRTYGFRSSPAANTWNFNPYVTWRLSVDAPDQIYTWSSACDPNTFNVSGSAGAVGNLLDSDVVNRLALSRLCGAVIPPGAIHDYPGDASYPSRGGTAPDTLDQAYLPTTAVPAEQSALNDRIREESENHPNNAGFAQAVVRDAFTSPTSPINSGSFATQEEFRYASVLPEFPVLYYIFPEFDHGQIGTSETVDGISVNHSQPNAPGTTPAAFQPWVEPYAVQSSAINGNTVTFQRVSTAASPGQPSPSVDYGTGFDQTWERIDPPLIVNLKYKAARVFPSDLSANLGVVPTEIANWQLPKLTTVTPSDLDTAPPNLIRYGTPDNSTLGAVPFVDRVLFNGREWLPSRVLDIDLEMLRTASIGGNDYWLPVSGIIYAFREDARREDAIERQSNGLPPAPLEASFTRAQAPDYDPTTLGTGTLAVNAGVTDPATAGPYSVSTKAVDFIADPDRRVDGFRLRRGTRVDRPTAGVPPEKNVRGITFVTDNLAYIMGDFNRHAATPGGPRLEEFTALLPDDPNAYNTTTFYDNRTDIDTNFARQDTDLWRPSEILADSITILSENFCDGSMLDTFMNAGYQTFGADGGLSNDRSSGSAAAENAYTVFGAAPGAGVYNTQSRGLFGPGCRTAVNPGGATSFLNQNRPRTDLASGQNWVRENPADPINSPVKVSRNGNGLVGIYNFDGTNPIPSRITEFASGEYSGQYVPGAANPYFAVEDDGGLDTSRPLQRAVETDVNAILISGIVPSRNQQGYGGLHNFPRLLEWWEGRPLRIHGSFLQLNFSNYGTAPYDQDRWEPVAGAIPTAGDEQIDYYGFAPLRLWGYDVGLQFAPASPAASRFTTPNAALNEFYDEPKANDPYMRQMCTRLTTTLSLDNVRCPG
jgi:hypothetical protein